MSKKILKSLLDILYKSKESFIKTKKRVSKSWKHYSRVHSEHRVLNGRTIDILDSSWGQSATSGM